MYASSKMLHETHADPQQVSQSIYTYFKNTVQGRTQ